MSGRPPSLAWALGIACVLLTLPSWAAAGDTNGEALAERLRSIAPSKDSESHGVMDIDAKVGGRTVEREIPFLVQVKAHDSTWETIYQTLATNQADSARLVIVHSASKPSQFFYEQGVLTPGPPPESALLQPSQLSTPFAGSDFSVGELGMDFLQWPGQTKLKGEMRLSRWCDVLESTNPLNDGITRVKSDFDQESGGLLIAEAYDSKGVKLKEFSVGGSYKTINGLPWLEKVEIRTLKTNSHTTLKFDKPKD